MNLTDKILNKYLGNTGLSESKKVTKSTKYNPERLYKAEAALLVYNNYIKTELKMNKAYSEAGIVTKVKDGGKKVWEWIKKMLQKLWVVIKETFKKFNEKYFESFKHLRNKIQKIRKSIEKDAGNTQYKLIVNNYRPIFADLSTKAIKYSEEEIDEMCGHALTCITKAHKGMRVSGSDMDKALEYINLLFKRTKLDEFMEYIFDLSRTPGTYLHDIDDHESEVYQDMHLQLKDFDKLSARVENHMKEILGEFKETYIPDSNEENTVSKSGLIIYLHTSYTVLYLMEIISKVVNYHNKECEAFIKNTTKTIEALDERDYADKGYIDILRRINVNVSRSLTYSRDMFNRFIKDDTKYIKDLLQSINKIK